jgi:Domain of unknown function (DUF5005)
MSRALRKTRAGAAVMALASLSLLPALPAVAAPPAPIVVTPDLGLDALWDTYGDVSGQWNGGDGTASVTLPDGRTVWIFSDTFVGALGPNHQRNNHVHMIHNTIVVQRDGVLGPTYISGGSGAPTGLLETPSGFAWVANGTVEGGNLKILFNRYTKTGRGPLDIRLDDTLLATLSLPDLKLTGTQPVPVSGRIAWGQALLKDCAYTYVYGSEHDAEGSTYAHVARAPAGDLGGRWEFWDGLGWSGQEEDSARLVRGVGTAFGVIWAANQYVLVTQDNTVPSAFSSSIVAFTAPSPTGPFGAGRELFKAPEAGTRGKQIIVYDARVHPAISPPGKLVVSYNVNSLNPAENNADGTIYRPRFMDVNWPLPR